MARTCSEGMAPAVPEGMPVVCPHRLKWVLLALAALLLAAVALLHVGGTGGPASTGPSRAASIARTIAPPSRGYQPRPCGFDLDRDGNIGDPLDRRIADGRSTDPDGDGVAEDLWYVDGVVGDDQRGDGSPASPFRTIGRALDAADGPANGREDIICLHGVFDETVALEGKHRGLPGAYRRGDFEYPRQPFMVVGWDKDGDGEFPPYDPDDLAVLDGRGARRLAVRASEAVSCIEIAHLTVRDFNHEAEDVDSGAFWLRAAGEPQTHVYVHDVELRRINDGNPGRSGTIVVGMFPAGATLSHFAFENNRVEEFGGYFCRGSGSGTGREDGPWRFQGNTLTARGVDGASASSEPDYARGVTGWKLWAEVSDVAIEDNVFDGNAHRWQPTAFVGAIAACQGAQRWTIRNNEFRDCNLVLAVQPDAGPQHYHDRPTTDIVFDRNLVRNTYAGWGPYGKPTFIRLEETSSEVGAKAFVGKVTITNNYMSSVPEAPSNAAVWCYADHYQREPPGMVTIAGNTFVGPFGWDGGQTYAAAVAIVRAFPNQPPFRKQDFVIRGNIFARCGPFALGSIRVDYAPRHWSADGNVFDPEAPLVWDAAALPDLAAWQQATGQDARSRSARPRFANPEAGDFHLHPEDTAARGAGVDLGAITALDYDGDLRGAYPPCAGADVGPGADGDRRQAMDG